MDVTKSNLDIAIKDFEEIISKSEFLAIDGEFTGLNYGEMISSLDTPPLYYMKVRNAATEFLMIQFGLCAFYYDYNESKFKYKPYNFFIFPRTGGRMYGKKCFKMQPSSLSFLAENGFDFNKLYKDGIPFLRSKEEIVIRDKLQEKYKTPENKVPKIDDFASRVPIPPDLTEKVEYYCVQLKTFLEDDDKTELVLDCNNGFLRKLMYQEVPYRFPDIYLETRNLENGNRALVASRLGSEEDQRERLKCRMEAELQDLETAIGFSHVIRTISKSGKLIIGHNMLMDLCLIMNQFFEDLPNTYSDFKSNLHSLFPRLLDTKYMSSCDELKNLISSNVLQHMKTTLMDPPFKFIEAEPDDIKYAYKLSDEKLHEAGYDAYITGLCFLTMAQHLGVNMRQHEHNLMISPVLEPYINKLFLMRIQDCSHMNLNGRDSETKRENVYHITFPTTWKSHDIVQVFKQFGKVQVVWLTDSTAFVSLESHKNSKRVLNNLKSSKDYCVVTFKKYQETVLNNSGISNSPEKTVMSPQPKKRSRMQTLSVSPIPEEEEHFETEENSRNKDTSSMWTKYWSFNFKNNVIVLNFHTLECSYVVISFSLISWIVYFFISNYL